MSVENIIMLTDSYKVTHAPQYPPKTTKVYSYFESRGGEYPEVTFFGLQMILKRYLVGQVVTQERINKAEDYVTPHLRGDEFFNREGWEYILNKHDGRLPVTIKAVPEGTVVPIHNVLMTVENNDPKLHWLTNYIESLLVQTWYPSTVATVSREVKKSFKYFLEKTGPSLENLDFKLHDFGFRGASSVETASIGGVAHLVNFLGTDNMPALVYARRYYGERMAGFSIPASEHSTMTSWGKAHEIDAMRNMLEQYPSGMFSCVSDSWDIFKACREYWGETLKAQVLARDGVVVVRPDSGDVVEVPTKCIDILGNKFGTVLTPNRYKLLDPHIRLIQGDGMAPRSIIDLLVTMKLKQWAADNLTVGMGGGLLQRVNRDTQKFAFKCSYIEVNGVGRNVWKDPIHKGKKSKRGTLALIEDDGQYRTVPLRFRRHADNNLLVTVFENGRLIRDWTLKEVRERASVV